MKRMMLICLALSAGCNDEKASEKNLTGEWAVSWEYGDDQVKGKLLMSGDQEASLILYGHAGSQLLKETASAGFKWRLNNDQLVFTRTDNNVALTYKIIDRENDKVTLSFNNEIYVKLTR